MAIKLSQKAKGILSVIGSSFFYLVIGSTFIWGSINIYASSYFKNIKSDETSVVFPVSIAITNVGILLSFPLLRLIGFRFTVYLSTALMFGFFLASSFCQEFWSFFFCFAVGYGGSSGLLYLTLMYNNYKYFPSSRGLIGGIAMGMYGLAALISNYVLLLLINPENVAPIKNPETHEFSFPEEIANRFPSALRYLSFYFIGLMSIGCILQFEFVDPEDDLMQDVNVNEESFLEPKCPDLRGELLPKSFKTQDEENFLKPILNQNVYLAETSEPQNVENESTNTPVQIKETKPELESEVEEVEIEQHHLKQGKRKNEWSMASRDPHDETRCLLIKDAFKSRVFHMIVIMMFMSVANGYFISMNFKNYGIQQIPDDGFLTLVGSLSAMFNGGGRMFWGMISDKYDFKKVYLIILVIQILDIATLRFISSYKIAYLSWVSVALLCEGGHFVIFPPLSLRVFGPEVGSKIYSLLLLACSGSNLTQFGFNLLLHQKIGFENEFFIFLGMSLLALLVCLSAEMRFKK